MSRRRRVGIAGAVVGAASAGVATAALAKRYAVGRIRLRPDPEANEPFGELRGREVTVTASDGVRLHVEVDGPDDAPITLVLCHGYTLNLDSWHYQRRDLREQVGGLVEVARHRLQRGALLLRGVVHAHRLLADELAGHAHLLGDALHLGQRDAHLVAQLVDRRGQRADDVLGHLGAGGEVLVGHLEHRLQQRDDRLVQRLVLARDVVQLAQARVEQAVQPMADLAQLVARRQLRACLQVAAVQPLQRGLQHRDRPQHPAPERGHQRRAQQQRRDRGQQRVAGQSFHQRLRRVALARRLKRDITVAYLDWLRASRAVEIVQASLELLEENLRVNESLFRNGKLTQDQVLRARAELLEVEQQLREARDAVAQAQSYVNFLLNRSLDEPLRAAVIEREIERTTQDLAALRAAALANRPELDQLESAAKAAQAREHLARAALKPTLSLGVDGGIQGEEYGFGSGRNFGMISLLLQWELFDGGARRAEVRSARAAARQAETRRDELAQQIQLEVQQALDRLQTAADSLAIAEARLEAAQAGFRIASRKRDEGVISQVEFIDARSALTRAELNLNLTRFELLSRQAELDYATAAGPLPLDLAGPAMEGR